MGKKDSGILRDLQFYKFSAYGFLKNLRFFDPFIILFFRQMGMSFLEIGTLVSIREVATMILEVPTGFVADAYGRKNAMVFAFLSYIISFLIFYFFPSFLLYAAAMVFFAFGEAFRTGTHKAMILDYLKSKGLSHLKVQYYGSTRSWSQVGSAVSALAAGALVFYSGGYRIVFVASVVPYIAGLLLMISYPQSLNVHHRVDREAGILKGALHNICDTMRGFLDIFKNRNALKALFNSSLYDGLFKTVEDYLQPILKDFALTLPVLLVLQERRSTVLIAATYFLLYLLTAVSSKNAHRFANLFRSLDTAVNVGFLAGVVLTAMAGVLFDVDLKILTILIFILLHVAMNFRRPVMVSCVSEYIDASVMATGLSVESQMKTLTVAVFAPLMGLLADLTDIGVGIIVLSAILLLAFPLVLVRKHQSQD
ncbi:MAG: MFS transporter [Spirochaetes bacterium]|nr:MFS transporter [Spirochaetota bacterium]